MKSVKLRRIDLKNALKSIAFQDVMIFEAIACHGSLAAASRALRLKAPRVTKSLQRLESHLGLTLVSRTSQGVSLTPHGQKFLLFCQSLADSLDRANLASGNPPETVSHFLTMVGPMYLIAHMVAPQASNALRNEGVGIRLMHLDQTLFAAASPKNFFDTAVHCGELVWPRNWKSYPIGSVQWVLCSRRGHPLGATASEEQVLDFPFILPLILEKEGFRTGSDDCPVPLRQRRILAEVNSNEIGLKICESSDALIFMPEVQARSMILQSRIQTVEVKGWPPVRKTAYLTVHQDKVSHRLLRLLTHALEAGLAERFHRA